VCQTKMTWENHLQFELHFRQHYKSQKLKVKGQKLVFAQ
jgi:hypothetical protein